MAKMLSTENLEQSIRFSTTGKGVQIAYATLGKGAPLVKAANLLGHLEFDWKSPVWRHWLLELAQYNTLVRYDERGCGLSDWEIDDFSLNAWVEDLETVVDTLGLKRFPLLGLSQGGPIAITYASRHPEKVSQLILYGSYARGRYKRGLSPDQVEEVDTLLKLMKIGWGRENPAFRQVFTTLLMPDATNEENYWLNELQRLSTTPENAVQFRKTFYTLDVSTLASQITAPTLVLHARGDAAVPFKEGRHLAAIIPGARFVPLESNNHILRKDEPAWLQLITNIHNFLGRDARSKPKSSANQFPELTGRELEILDLIAQGLNNSSIAECLVISPNTVRNHITNIFSKLQITDRSQAIVMARKAGLGQEK